MRDQGETAEKSPRSRCANVVMLECGGRLYILEDMQWIRGEAELSRRSGQKKYVTTTRLATWTAHSFRHYSLDLKCHSF
jgi:hypothetical protein